MNFFLSGINVEPADIKLSGVGQTQQLTVTGSYSDESTNNLTSGSTGTTYTSADTSVVSINDDGLVTAVGVGTAVITVTNGDYSQDITVIVDSIVVIEALNFSSKSVEPNNEISLQCIATSNNQDPILSYEWEVDGAILPQTDSNIVWTATDTKGMYKICCRASDNYGDSDYTCLNIFVIEPELLTFETDEEGKVSFFDENINDNVKVEAHDLNGNPLDNFEASFLISGNLFDMCVSDPRGNLIRWRNLAGVA